MKGCITTIGDLCSTISDTFKGKDSEVVLVNTSDVLEGKILNDKPVENKNLKGQFKKTFQKDDILYSEIRPANKRFAYVTQDDTHNYIASTKLMVLRPNKDVVRPRFLFHLLKSQALIDEMQHLAETRSGTFPQITFSTELAPYEVLLPDFDMQDKIVYFLDCIENKMENNAQINRNLSEQAFALFKEMFPNINQGEHTLGEYLSAVKGKALLSKDAVEGKVPVIAGGLSPATYHNTANTKAPVLTISASGANAGYVALWHRDIWSSDSSYIDSNMTDNVYFWYAMLKTRQKEIFDAQTGSAQPHIYPKNIDVLPVMELDEKAVTDYTIKVSSLFEMIGSNLNENEKLAVLRDSLLPRLMSGELDVSEVEI